MPDDGLGWLDRANQRNLEKVGKRSDERLDETNRNLKNLGLVVLVVLVLSLALALVAAAFTS